MLDRILVPSLIAIASLQVSAQASASPHQGLKPNIIVIYADDIGYGDFSCYGGTG